MGLRGAMGNLECTTNRRLIFRRIGIIMVATIGTGQTKDDEVGDNLLGAQRVAVTAHSSQSYQFDSLYRIVTKKCQTHIFDHVLP